MSPNTASADVSAEEAAEIEEEAPAEAKPARKPRKAFRIPSELPRVEIIHDLPESQKTCPHDGTALKHIKVSANRTPPFTLRL